MPLTPQAVQAATAAPQATQTLTAAAASKPPPKKATSPLAGAGAAPAKEEAAPAGRGGPKSSPGLEETGVSEEALRRSKEAFLRRPSDKSNEYYRTKLEDVARLRAAQQIGPGGSVRGVQLNPEDLARGGTANVTFVRGVEPFLSDPKSLGESLKTLPQALPDMPGRENFVEVPMGGPGGTLDSVAAFRQRAEQLGLRYREAKRARAQGDEEIEQAQKNPATRRSIDLPRLAAAQRQRTQEFVTAREALRQMGFVGNDTMTAEQEMNQKFDY